MRPFGSRFTVTLMRELGHFKQFTFIGKVTWFRYLPFLIELRYHRNLLQQRFDVSDNPLQSASFFVLWRFWRLIIVEERGEVSNFIRLYAMDHLCLQAVFPILRTLVSHKGSIANS